MPRAAPGLVVAEKPWQRRPAYTRDALALALREGRAPGGQLDELMPRYDLAEADVAALAAYLRRLGSAPEPGIEGRTIHFATVVASDADPAQARAMTDVLHRCIADKSPASRRSGANVREWKLHQWQLPPDRAAWPAELARLQRQRPVFALVSGISSGSWAPVHAFCEGEGVPCLFPLVEVPPQHPEPYFSFYLSEGLRLDGKVLAARLQEQAAPGRVVQLFDPADAASASAAALRDGLAGSGWQVDDMPLHGANQTDAGRRALNGVAPGDTVVLWLRRAALADIVSAMPAPPKAGAIYLSGVLAGLDDAPLTPSWRAVVRVVYPFETLDRRLGRTMLNAGGWLENHGLTITRETERTLGASYSTCELVARAMYAMQDRYSRDYLLEQVENGAESAVAMPFLRFTLGPGQRFGAKGAFITWFSDPDAPMLKRDGSLVVP